MLLHEDEHFLVLNKEPGIPVFPFHHRPDGSSLYEQLLIQAPEQGEHLWPSGFDGGIAHRLDVATSGAVWVARNPESLRQLRELFSQKKLLKSYFFLTRKQVGWTSHLIDKAIAHDRKKKSRMVVQRGINTPHRGRWYPAKTELSLVAEGSEIVMWEAKMRTGVMHQIRLHAAFAGIALAGDRLYGGGEPLVGAPVGFALHHRVMYSPALPSVLAPVPLFWRSFVGLQGPN